MIQIAVCDDCQFDMDLLCSELERYAAKKHLDFDIRQFSKPVALQYEMNDGIVADIYILDVTMPGVDGFQLADEIRKHTTTSIILFLTSHEEQAASGYKSKALRYIIKLNLLRDLEEAMDSAIEELSVLDQCTITLHRYGDYWRVPYRDIISVTRICRQLVIETVSNGELTDNRGISDFYHTLNDKRFLFIDRSCFVNIDYISKISGYNLVLKDGKSLPISRRSLQHVKQTLLDQWGL